MEKKPQKHIIDVVPLTRIPLNRSQSFSYLHDNELPEGTLVSVPLFRRSLPGIVLKSRNDFRRLGNIYPDTKKLNSTQKGQLPRKNLDASFGVGVQLKKIESVVEENFLDKKQLELAEFLSDYYVSPLGIILKAFVPKRVKARKEEVLAKKKPLKKRITLTKYQKSAVEKITGKNSKSYKLKTNRYLLYGPSASGKTEAYLEVISKLKTKNPKLQFLILLPELVLTPQALERFEAHFNSDEIALLGSNISPGKFYSDWQKIRSGEAKLIIGTRMAVFAPFQKLGLIVVDEAQDASFKQWDMNPRYDARKAGEKLSEIHSCPIVFGSATPRVEDYYRAIQGEYELLKLPYLELKSRNTELKTEIVDMKKERWAKRFSPISEKLKSEIYFTLKHQGQVLLFINRQSMSSFSICEKCKSVLRCPHCDRALVYSKEGYYLCLHCAHKTSIFPKCPKCSGMEFKNLGTGTEKVEKEIEKLFPGAKIIRLDSGRKKDKSSLKEIYEKFRNHQADILIGTQMISKGWDLPDLALVGIIEADALFSLPDYFTDEKGFAMLLQLKGRLSRPNSRFKGNFLIQTFHPENKLVQLASEGNCDAFFQDQLKQRQTLQIPPFSKMIRLTFQDLKEEKTEKEALRFFQDFQKKKPPSILISPPQKAFLGKIRGRFRQQITLKLLKDADEESLRILLSSLPSGWIIDVDPVSLI